MELPDAATAVRSTDSATMRDERLVAACLALIGCSIATYLSLYQYSIVAHVWEPFFGQGSVVVLKYGWLAPVSRMVRFPIHDAPFGVIAYLVEAGLALTLLSGDRTHERSGLRLCYVAIVLALGLGSVGLVIVQGVVLHAWCTLCLASAMLSEMVVFVSRRDISAAFKGLRTQRSPRERLPSQSILPSK